MSTPTASQTRAISLSSEFDAVADATIDAAVEEAGLHYTGLTGEPEHTKIVALHACHLLKLVGLGSGGGLGGPVSSASAGAVSVGSASAAVAPSAGLDMRTPYGERALSLLASLPASLRSGGPSYWAP